MKFDISLHFFQSPENSPLTVYCQKNHVQKQKQTQANNYVQMWLEKFTNLCGYIIIFK